MADDVATFLLARFDEDEAAVVALRTRTPPRHHPRSWRADITTDQQGEDGITLSPARVLAEVEAKRRIAELHRPTPCTEYDGDRDGRPTMRTGRPSLLWPTTSSEATLKALALPYAGHPDYREEWKA